MADGKRGHDKIRGDIKYTRRKVESRRENKAEKEKEKEKEIEKKKGFKRERIDENIQVEG